MAATYTPNYNLKKPAGTDGYLITDHNDNSDKVEAALTDISKAFTAGGTGTAITLTVPSLAAYRTGLLIHIIAASNNSAAATTLNINGLGAKSIYKPGTTDAPNIVAGKGYTFWYNGTNFFLQASAGVGTAVAGDVLAGETFSSDLDSEIMGTMPDRGAVIITPSTVNQTIALGKHNGSGYVKGDADLVPSKIKLGENIFDVEGACGETIYNVNYGLPPF